MSKTNVLDNKHRLGKATAAAFFGGAAIMAVAPKDVNADTVSADRAVATDQAMGNTDGLASSGKVSLINGTKFSYTYKGTLNESLQMQLGGNPAYCLELSAQNPAGVEFKGDKSTSPKSTSAIFQAINLGYPTHKGADYGVSDFQLYQATQGLVWIMSDARGSAQVTNGNLKFTDPTVEALINKLAGKIDRNKSPEQTIQEVKDSVQASSARAQKLQDELDAKAKKDAESEVNSKLTSDSKSLTDSIKYGITRVVVNNKANASDGTGNDKYDAHDYTNGTHSSTYKVNYSANSALKLAATSKLTFEKQLPAGTTITQNGKKVSTDGKSAIVNNNQEFTITTPFSNDSGQFKFTAAPTANATGEVSASSTKTGANYKETIKGTSGRYSGIQEYSAQGGPLFPDSQATIGRVQDIVAAVPHTVQGKPVDITGKGNASGKKGINVASKGDSEFAIEKMYGVPTLHKVDDKGKAIKNTIFALYETDDKQTLGKKIGEYTTDADGNIVPGKDGSTNQAGNADPSTWAHLRLGQNYAWKEIQSDGKHQTDSKIIPGKIDNKHVLWGNVTKRADQYTLTTDRAVNHDLVTNEHELESQAAFGDGSFTAPASDNIEVRDKLAGKLDQQYVNQKLTVKTTLMDKQTRKPVEDKDGKPVVIKRTTTPTSTNFNYEAVVGNVNTSKLAGHDIVLFEDLLDDKGSVISKEHDLGNEAQTLHVKKQPTIRTVATSENGNKTANPTKQTTVIDRVDFKDVTPGKPLKVTAHLMDQETGKPLKDKDGKEITQTVSFTPKETTGSINVPITLDASLLKGKKTVFFEDLKENDKKIASFNDIHDKDETVEFGKPEITTTAKLNNGSKVDFATKDGKVIDNTQGRGIEPGDYELSGQLMNKKTGKAVLDKSGKPVIANKRITVGKNGKMDENLTFDNFDATELDGADTVVFETLKTSPKTDKSDKTPKNSEVVVEDKKIDNPSETVTLKPKTDKPEITTTAKSSNNKQQTDHGAKNGGVDDTVMGQNIPEGDYDLHGVLMDKETGKPVIGDDGKEVTHSKKVTVGKDGKIQDNLHFDGFDGTKLNGHDTVVFETLYKTDKNGKREVVADDKKLNNPSETVRFEDQNKMVPTPTSNNKVTPSIPGTNSGAPSMSNTMGYIKNHKLGSFLVAVAALIGMLAVYKKIGKKNS